MSNEFSSDAEERKIYKDLSNEEAEQGLLGVLLTNNGIFAKVCNIVSADDFYDLAHQRIYDAVARRISDGQQADPVTLAPEFRDDPDLAQNGGAAYLGSLVAGVVTVVNARDYAETIADLSRRRRLVMTAYDAIAAASDWRQPVTETVGSVLADMERLTDSRRSRTGNAVIDDMLESWRGEPAIYSTGFPSIDGALGGGLIPGEVTAICAQDKVGKTMLAASISHSLNSRGVAHGYAALEMGATQIERRHIARDVGIGTSKLRGRIDPKVIAAVARYRMSRQSHVTYIDLPGATVAELRSEIVAAKARRKIVGCVVDYWQLVSGGSERETQEAHLSRVANWISTMAKRLNLWVILLAQLNDEGTAPAYSKRGLNRAVDHLLYLHRDDESEWAWLALKKSRHMPACSIGSPDEPSLRVRFPGPYFEDWAARGEDNSDAAQAQREMAETYP